MVSGCVCRPGAAEFPHDNEQIDRGVLWIGGALAGAEAPRVMGTGRTRGTRTSVATSPPPLALAEIANVALRAATVSTMLPPPMVAAVTADCPRELATNHTDAVIDHEETHDERIELFVRTIAEVARAHGAAESAAHVEYLFKFGTPAPLALSDHARTALRDGNILEIEDGPDHATPWFTSTSSAWQSMLRGESSDLSACGESTLDSWTAELIARLVAKPGLAQTIRRDLRRRGIAAFGMLEP